MFVPLGVAALFLGFGAFHRDAMGVGAALVALGASLIGIAWKFLKAPTARPAAQGRRPDETTRNAPPAPAE